MVKRTDIVMEARQLAKTHREVDPNTEIIMLYSANGDRCIRLLEVASDVATTCTRGTAEPFLFDKKLEDGITHPISIILASNEEWQAIQDGKLKLPREWRKRTGQPL